MKMIVESEMLEQVLEELQSYQDEGSDREITDALQSALATAEKAEPVAKVTNSGIMPIEDTLHIGQHLYAAPVAEGEKG